MESRVSSVTFLFVIRAIASQTGISEEILIQKSGLDPSLFSQESMWVESERLSEVFQYAMQESDDPYLALHIGESVPYQSLGLLGYLLINAASVAEMLEKFGRYQKLIGERLKFDFSDDGAQYRIALCLQGNPMIPVPRFHAEVHLSAILNIICQLSGVDIKPARVCFWHVKPPLIEGYANLFGSDLFFGESESAIYLTKKALEIPLQYANLPMLGFFEAQARRIIEDIEETSCYARVRQIILSCLGENDITIDFVALRMGVSARVLQKQLKAEQKTFREALNSVRIQLARHYLEKSDADIGTIAMLLGYSEASAFLRAFKKHTGCTPGEVRKS